MDWAEPKAQEPGNHAKKHKIAKINLIKTINSFKIKHQIRVKWIGTTNIMKPWSTNELIEALNNEKDILFNKKWQKRHQST